MRLLRDYLLLARLLYHALRRRLCPLTRKQLRELYACTWEALETSGLLDTMFAPHPLKHLLWRPISPQEQTRRDAIDSPIIPEGCLVDRMMHQQHDAAQAKEREWAAQYAGSQWYRDRLGLHPGTTRDSTRGTRQTGRCPEKT